ncbi:hypothetical protein ACFY9N_11985 [Microbacterium sp. NPDC008134]|jgi:hypothetical protein|uniref:hypothetical protein n=1 Tax=Microbacterium sp. NPDC008134 TaxID=3364183 RepID=UPI0036E6685C
MLVAVIRPLESHTVELTGKSLEDVHVQLTEHAPAGFDLVSAPARMLKGAQGIETTARFDRRDGTREIEAEDMDTLLGMVPDGWQMLSVRRA